MKADIRWQLLLAVICFGLASSLLSLQVQTSGECTTRVPTEGGTLAEGIIGLPRRLNPLFANANPVDQELTDLIFDGLVRYDENGYPVGALAESWEFSEDGRSVTFELRDNLRWHDGRPVTAEDVAFTYGLLQDDDLPVGDEMKALWQAVEIVPIGSSRIEFILPQAYAPFVDATTVGILPAHRLQSIPVGQIADHPFNRSPVGTGPFLVVPNSDWQRSGSLRLAPNPSYWREPIPIDTIEFRFYQDGNALRRAFERGEIQALAAVPPDDILQIASLPGMRLFTSPAPRITQLLFNMTESAAPALDAPPVRKALALGLDRESLVDEAVNGQGLPVEGPFLPESWAFDAGLLTTYRHDPERAKNLLTETGWLAAEGELIRQREGEPMVLRLLAAAEPSQLRLADLIGEQWSVLGVRTELIPVNPETFEARLAERAYDVAIVEVQSSGDPDLYDFWSQQAILTGQNYGGWNNRAASEALEAARQLPKIEERRPYYQAFLRFFGQDLPALTLYQHVRTYGVSDQVRQAEVGRIHSPRDQFQSLARWTLLYREVAVACSDLEA